MVKDFNPKSDEFTLEKIIEFGFDNYAELIHDISGAASKVHNLSKIQCNTCLRPPPHPLKLPCTY
jgi:hypothetical protein